MHPTFKKNVTYMLFREIGFVKMGWFESKKFGLNITSFLIVDLKSKALKILFKFK